PSDFLRRERQAQAAQSCARFLQGARTNKRKGRKRLTQYVSQGDIERAHPAFCRQFRRTPAPLPIVRIVPTAKQFFIRARSRQTIRGKIPPGLTRPGKERRFML